MMNVLRAFVLGEEEEDEDEKQVMEEDWSLLDGELNEECETLRQFLLDAPRMNISIDDAKWAGSASDLFSTVFCALWPRTSALLAAEFCTQTALAPYFCAVQERLVRGVHLVDGGRQKISLSSNQSNLRIEKPFKLVDFDPELNARILFFVTLKIQVDLLTGVALHRFLQSGENEDWVVLGDGEEEEETSSLVLVAPHDIAARAARLHHNQSSA